MTNTYALMKDGIVINTIMWEGPEISPIQFDEGVSYAEMPDSKGNTPSIGWTFKKGIFSPPPLTGEELEKNNEKAIAANSAMKQLLMEEASKEISIFQDAVDLDMATDEEALALPKWKKYRVLLSRVDANVAEPVSWPEKP